jgi:hypothetical protein
LQADHCCERRFGVFDVNTLSLILLIQADVVGDSIGEGIVRVIVIGLITLGVIAGFFAFLWMVRKVDKKINK